MDQDERQRKAAAEYERLFKEARNNDLAFIIGTPQGARFLQGLVGLTGYWSVASAGNSQDYIAAGKRKIGEELLMACARIDPNFAAKMQDEHFKMVTALEAQAMEIAKNG